MSNILSILIVLLTLAGLVGYAFVSPDYLPTGSFLGVVFGIMVTGGVFLAGVLSFRKGVYSFDAKRRRNLGVLALCAGVLCLGATVYAGYSLKRPSLVHVQKLMDMRKSARAIGMWCQMLNPDEGTNHTLSSCPIQSVPLDASADILEALDVLLSQEQRYNFSPTGTNPHIAELKQAHRAFKRFGLSEWLPKSLKYHSEWVKQKYEGCGETCYKEYIEMLNMLPGSEAQLVWLSERMAIASLSPPKEVVNVAPIFKRLGAIDAWNGRLNSAVYRSPTPEQHATFGATRVAAHILQRLFVLPVEALGASAEYVDARLSRQAVRQRILDDRDEQEIRVAFDSKGEAIAALYLKQGVLEGVALMNESPKVLWEGILGLSAPGQWGRVDLKEHARVVKDVRAHRQLMRRYEDHVRKVLGPKHNSAKFARYENLHTLIYYDYNPKAPQRWMAENKRQNTELIQRNVAMVDQAYFTRKKGMVHNASSWPVVRPAAKPPLFKISPFSSGSGVETSSSSSTSSSTNSSTGFGFGSTSSPGSSFRSSSSSSGRFSSGSGGFSSGKN